MKILPLLLAAPWVCACQDAGDRYYDETYDDTTYDDTTYETDPWDDRGIATPTREALPYDDVPYDDVIGDDVMGDDVMREDPAFPGATETVIPETALPVTELSAEDRTFAEQAAVGGLFEVKSSELALEKDVQGDLRDFAQRMIDAHGRANRELQDLTMQKDVALPGTLDELHQRKLDDLRGLEGSEFEDAYREAQIEAHDEAIQVFERAAEQCQDAELQAFAQRTLPTLRDHRAQLDG